MPALLALENFTVELPTPRGWVRPVNEISLEIAEGEALGVVGESGSGKTMLSLGLMGLLPEGARRAGHVWLSLAKCGLLPSNPAINSVIPRSEATRNLLFSSSLRNSRFLAALGMTTGDASVATAESTRVDLAATSPDAMRKLRGRELAMIFQEPMTALDPVMRIGAQIEEALRVHNGHHSRRELHRGAIEALEFASVPEPERRARQFPHQLSGGLRQRAMIAMAIAVRPRLLIADEPTTALDVTVQKQILDLLARLRRELRLTLIFITHDLGVVGQIADRIAVMYAGRIAELGPAREVLARPRHPYTQGLLRAAPRLQKEKLAPIPGVVPQLDELPPGCAFAPRCDYRCAECDAAIPELRAASPEHLARCILVP